ncbi:GNAT family N-acetyltransferase [Frondihabitans sucicola]|nr:GNAT family protein [Frondihabitans sucicola]
MQHVEAKDLTLRPIRPSDAPRIHEWAANPKASVFQPWGPNTEADTAAFVDHALSAWETRPQSRWIWVAEDAHRFVTGLGELRIHSSHRAEISYAVDVALWGRGIGSAIGELLVSRAFDTLGVERVEATCDPRNGASAKILRRIGMTYEGRLRHTHRLAEGWRDSEIFSILRDERT